MIRLSNKARNSLAVSGVLAAAITFSAAQNAPQANAQAACTSTLNDCRDKVKSEQLVCLQKFTPMKDMNLRQIHDARTDPNHPNHEQIKNLSLDCFKKSDYEYRWCDYHHAVCKWNYSGNSGPKPARPTASPSAQTTGN